MNQKTMGWQWHQLHHMQNTCTSLQTDNHASLSSIIFYRPASWCPGQLSLLLSAGLEMSTGQSAAMLCSWGVKAGTVHSICG